jgi:hypothetical protein
MEADLKAKTAEFFQRISEKGASDEEDEEEK